MKQLGKVANRNNRSHIMVGNVLSKDLNSETIPFHEIGVQTAWDEGLNGSGLKVGIVYL
ncbi:hypothetical protein [Brevibacillus fluminis]|uniref:hypothetical protein n=1 Tax=Brevibacillus fluminis TaxID=511487 RepID=UPI00160580BA|nr:hypothetical protein [Brevibacillus fluminis]